VPFTINTAAISSVSPNNGLAGTQVTITGSGFGAAQGNGNVWLGTVPAIVNSWSDGQVVATVAPGAASGNAVILQNGVMSNAVPFAINLPQITYITPNTGSAGTVVTVTGSGFGATQGSGNVWIGSTYGSVIGWSNTQVTASVASNAVSGIVKVQQNGTWSNAVTFTVPTSLGGGGGGGGTSVTLVPNVINMLVGGTQPIEALNSSGQSVTGLTWASSNTAVVTLSTDDPPIVTAVGAGNATITAGSATSDVTVWTGSTLPTGTVIWSNPGDGSGVSSIVPAVPSSTGVADGFATNADGSVQAITASGQTALTTPNVFGGLIPDFQGGTTVFTGSAIYRLDGMTGIPSTWTYTSASGNNLTTPVVHTSGTIFTIDGSMVVGINPTTGQTFSVQMENSTSTGSSGCTNQCTSPLPPSPEGYSNTSPPSIGSLLIAGDGYAYVPYSYTISAGSSMNNGCGCGCSGSGSSTQFLNLLRVGPTGDSYEISLGEFSSAYSSCLCNYQSCGGGENTASATLPTLITNADQGVLASYSASYNYSTSYYLATTSGASLASNSQVAMVPEQTSPVQSVLQRQDGNFIGTVSSTVGSIMVAFTPSGGTLFTVPNDTPQIATSNNGVIGTSGTAYDQNGNVIGQTTNIPTQSWTGNSYQIGSIDQIAFSATAVATTFGIWPWGGSNTATQQQYYPPLDSCPGSPACNGGSIGYKEAVYNALADLISRLQSTTTVQNSNGNPITLGTLAQSAVFSKLGGGYTTAGFINYLTTKTPQFYNALTSSYCEQSLYPNSAPCWLQKFPVGAQTVSEYFNSNASTTAQTNTPNNPLQIFFRPQSIQLGYSGMNSCNESVIFHEALHGWTGEQDPTLLGIFYKNSDLPSVYITYYVWDNVLIKSPGLVGTMAPNSNTPCP
jgi:hypothetical protein